MTSYEPTTTVGKAALAAILDDPAGTVLALDFDGTLAPIIDDPDSALAHPRAVDALGRLGDRLAKIAVITGRAVETVVRLGGFEGRPGLGSMVVFGQYGVERWDAGTGEVVVPPLPAGIAGVEAELPGVLARAGLADARIEHKGRAIVLHTRGFDDSGAAFDKMRGPVESLAARHGLVVEPGRNVLEIRERGVHKGDAVGRLVGETGARQVIFGGDDLGDLPAFEAVEKLRRDGMPGMLLCSASQEQDALVQRADVVLDGPDAVADWLEWLAARLEV